MKSMRLDKFLTNHGIGSRNEVKKIIKSGDIRLNGEVITVSDTKIDPEQDSILYKGELLKYKRFYYYMLHKPAGVITATEDKHQETVLDLLVGVPHKDLYPVGRLDKDTEGLLLITNDGQLGHKLLSPKKHVDKTYFVLADGIVTDEDLSKLRNGIDIGEGIITMPAETKLLSNTPITGELPKAAQKFMISGENRSTLLLIIHEGKFHQVKRMMEAVGKPVLYLKRLSMGNLILDESLAPGEFRELKSEEIKALLH